ncbi:hypothetical protein G7071_09450 [Nocardioides piscis]|uniref:Uncharacterized protein n=1 Tax=Nocardioides piscis TaxID=2714938 RepID=A0A6G7YKU6_9ACTN|nr:hypothetical protein G7071_09450 [Nocardioides piscis]
MWRARESTYAAFVAHLEQADGFPTLLPWPLSPGWQISDFGVVARAGRKPQATVTCCSGVSELDGAVDVFVVSEEPGTGLGARVARLDRSYPSDVAEEPPVARVQVDGREVPLWAVSTSAADGEFDRAVLVGEASGRWLWIVLHPASAMLLMRDDWILRDASGAGAALIEMTFGGTPPRW